MCFVCCFSINVFVHVICALRIDFIYIHSFMHFLTVRSAENKLQKCKSSYYKVQVYTLPKKQNPFGNKVREIVNKEINLITITFWKRLQKYNKKELKREKKLNRERPRGFDPFLELN